MVHIKQDGSREEDKIMIYYVVNINDNHTIKATRSNVTLHGGTQYMIIIKIKQDIADFI